jgi:hypothetical protein
MRINSYIVGVCATIFVKYKVSSLYLRDIFFPKLLYLVYFASLISEEILLLR